MLKLCSICKQNKDYEEFYIRNKGSNSNCQSYCKDCSGKQHVLDIKRLKLEAFNIYGGPVCACCGQNGHISFLALDHVENNGAEERRRLNMESGGYRFYCWLKRNNWPLGYQVLCHTCNVAKQINGGVCPHKFQLADSVTSNTSLSESEDSRRAS